MSWINVNDCCGCENCVNCGRSNRKVLVCDECHEEKDQYYTNGEKVICGDCLREYLLNFVFDVDSLVAGGFPRNEYLFLISRVFGFNLIKFAPDRYSFVANGEIFNKEDWYEEYEVLDVMKEMAEDFSADELIKLEVFNNWNKMNY